MVVHRRKSHVWGGWHLVLVPQDDVDERALDRVMGEQRYDTELNVEDIIERLTQALREVG